MFIGDKILKNKNFLFNITFVILFLLSMSYIIFEKNKFPYSLLICSYSDYSDCTEVAKFYYYELVCKC